MEIFGGFRIVASTVWIGWIRGYENPNVNGFQILWQKRFSAKTKCRHRSCSIDSLEKRLLLARGNAATPCDCLECRKNREEAIPHEKRNLRLVSEISISMLLEMLYIYASRNAIYLCFSKCFSKRRLSLIEKQTVLWNLQKCQRTAYRPFPGKKDRVENPLAPNRWLHSWRQS